MWAATCATFGFFSSWRMMRSSVLTCSPVSGSVSKMSFFAYQTRVRKYGSWPRSTQLSHQPGPSFWQFCRSGEGSRRGTKRPSGVTSTSNCEYGQMGCIILTMRIDELSLTPWENPGIFLSCSLAAIFSPIPDRRWSLAGPAIAGVALFPQTPSLGTEAPDRLHRDGQGAPCPSWSLTPGCERLPGKVHSSLDGLRRLVEDDLHVTWPEPRSSSRSPTRPRRS